MNRNPELFDESCQLLSKGSYIDITAFPAGTADPGLEAADAIQLAVSRGLPLEQITVSSDGGGCLPCFDHQGELLHMDFGRASTLHETVCACLASGLDLATVLPMFTSNVANLLRLPEKGRIKVGCDADLLILDDKYQMTDVMVKGCWHKRQSQQVVTGTFE